MIVRMDTMGDSLQKPISAWISRPILDWLTDALLDDLDTWEGPLASLRSGRMHILPKTS